MSDEIQAREVVQPVTLAEVREGDRLVILDGPMAGTGFTVEWIHEQDMVDLGVQVVHRTVYGPTVSGGGMHFGGQPSRTVGRRVARS